MRGYAGYTRLYELQSTTEMANRFLSIITKAVFGFGGTVVHYGTEQVIIIFNAPLPQPDHAWRAVWAALEVRDRIAAYHESLHATHPHRLIQFGYGVHTGGAVVGGADQARRQRYTAQGAAIDTGIRLAKAAEPGQIVLGDSTHEAIAGFVSVEPLSPIFIEGEPAPIFVFSVSGRLPHSTSVSARLSDTSV
jgi:adenylate cyclase